MAEEKTVGILKLTTDDGKLKAKRQWVVLTSKFMTFGSPEKKESYAGRISISKIESSQEGPDSDSFIVVSMVEDKKGKESKMQIIFTAEQTSIKKIFWEKLSAYSPTTSLPSSVTVLSGGSTKSGKGTFKGKKRPLSGLFGKTENSIPEESSTAPPVARPAAPPPLMPPTTASSTSVKATSEGEKSTELKTSESESSQGGTMTKSNDSLHERTQSQIESLSSIVQPVREGNRKDKEKRQSLPVPRPAAPPPDKPVVKEVNIKGYFFLWEYGGKMEPGKSEPTDWTPYDDIAHEKIELAWRKDQEEVTLDHGFFAKETYKVILKGKGNIPMVQVNNVTKNTRLVRRFPTTHPYNEFTWFYDARNKQDTEPKWEKYNSVSQCYIERAFSLAEKSVILKHTKFFENNPYEIKFTVKGSHQKCIKTKKEKNDKTRTTYEQS
jgi:hypothetical protein